jgi:hypothetical protein
MGREWGVERRGLGRKERGRGKGEFEMEGRV